MNAEVKVEQLTSIEYHLNELSDLLVQVVNDGASIGFLPPMKQSVAIDYWDSALNPDVILFVAKLQGEIVGSVQLHLCSKQNGGHRAEIAKLMTHTGYRRKGIGRSLMLEAEKRAKQEGRTLLVLDTREGDPSNSLYTSLGYIQAGRIPGYAKSANGEFHPTIFYFKNKIG
ncbi:GNAT family N-acetyltransferase [Peribacillus simplex]|uniref:GNAT family N-acetyltransferase n=1 Tax=Peribacillus simplex TaxID=1478 RepID=UPI00203B8AC0|nr:GNAT family N-acetyltransferase [Peribacillus simplex]MCM3673722.1 GNAT family N-acetyltransferase [Peribacillus simplex]